MKYDFSDDEKLILGICEEDSREGCIKAMNESLDDLDDDPDMKELVQGTIDKISNLTDEEYLQIDFSDCEDKVEAVLDEAQEMADGFSELL